MFPLLPFESNKCCSLCNRYHTFPLEQSGVTFALRKSAACEKGAMLPDSSSTARSGQSDDWYFEHSLHGICSSRCPPQRKEEEKKTPTQTPSQVERQTVSEEADVSCHSGRLGHVSHAVRTKLSLPANDHHDKIRKYPPRKSGCRNSVKNKQESKVKEVSQCDYCKKKIKKIQRQSLKHSR